METVENIEMQRSISMPTKAEYPEEKPLLRSKEKQSVLSSTDDEIITYRSDDTEYDYLSPTEWIGSTIELNTDMRRNKVSIVCTRNRFNRVIEKNGRENVSICAVPEKSKRYLKDFVTTLIDMDWKYMLSMFIGSYVMSWFFFAILCFLVSKAHGDLQFNAETGLYGLGDGKNPCIMGVYDFVSIFLYSVELQTTLGFGEKYPSEECAETIFLYMFQLIFASAIEGGMVSIIYAKTARPAKQMTKLKFSDKAVVCFRDGKPCLLFRVCDPRSQQTIESKIRVYMIVDRPTQEGEIIKTHTELKLEGNGRQLIIWPEIVCHVIDDTSPLRNLTTAKDFNAAQFELFVSIVGTSPATAQITEARTSYIPREIYWGQRFVNIITYDAVNERHVIDYSNFNSTISVDMDTKNNEELN